jgi:hypothetical protein
VLSTPLMVYLARTIYMLPSNEPIALIEFSSPEVVETHLLEAYLPAVYDVGASAPDKGGPFVRGYRHNEVRRWLAFLARHLHRQQTAGLVWWRLNELIPPREPAFAIAFGSLCGILAGIPFAVGVGILMGIGDGIGTGIVVGVFIGPIMAFSAWKDGLDLVAEPVRMRFKPRRLLGHIAGSITVAVIGIALPEAVSGNAARLVFWLIFAIVAGVLIGSVSGIVTSAEKHELLDTRLAVRQDRTALLTVTAISGVMSGAAIGLGMGLVVGPSVAIKAGLGFGLIIGPIFAMVTVVSGLAGTAWATFSIARCWLGVCGNLPWHLVRFLDDAHHRGILRQVAAEYQFRHVQLQTYLAASPETDRPSDSLARAD